MCVCVLEGGEVHVCVCYREGRCMWVWVGGWVCARGRGGTHGRSVLSLLCMVLALPVLDLLQGPQCLPWVPEERREDT